MPARLLAAFAAPFGLLVAAWLAAPHLGALPPALSALKPYAAHVAIALGMAVSIGFGRGRAFFALALLASGHAVLRASPGALLYHAATIVLPLNLAAIVWQREKGVLNGHGLRYALLLGVEAALIAASCKWFAEPLRPLLLATPLPLPAFPPLGQPALAAAIVGGAAALASWAYRREALSLALASACAAFVLSAHARGDAAALFVAAAALVTTIAVLQDIFRMAFRDPLTGLMSRRALDEQLGALGARYAVAMVDIDHFKRVNDTHGHDTGDQVLRMVAGHLSRVRGARAYRYGGEEFALVFPGWADEDVLDALEALRESVAGYPFRLRGAGREKAGRRGRNSKSGAARTLKVTVSIGVAATASREAPSVVVGAADKALYRAKRKGRNVVCH